MWMTEGFHRPTCLEPQGLVPAGSPLPERLRFRRGHRWRGDMCPPGPKEEANRPWVGGRQQGASVLAATGRRIGALEGLDSGDNECCSATTNVAGIRRSPVGGPTPRAARVRKQDPYPCLESQKWGPFVAPC